MAKELEMRVFVECIDIPLGSRKEVIGTKHIVSHIEKTLDQVRPDKTGTPGYKYALSAVVQTREISLESYDATR